VTIPPNTGSDKQFDRAATPALPPGSSPQPGLVSQPRKPGLEKRSLPPALARVRKLLRELRTHQDSLSNYLNAYIICMERIAQCGEVATELDRAVRRPAKVADREYWLDVRKEFERALPLAQALTSLPLAGFDEAVRRFDGELARAVDAFRNLPSERKEQLVLRDTLSEQVALMRRTAKEIGTLYEHEAKKQQGEISNALGQINVLMDLQTEVGMTDANPIGPAASDRITTDERSDIAPKRWEPQAGSAIRATELGAKADPRPGDHRRPASLVSDVRVTDAPFALRHEDLNQLAEFLSERALGTSAAVGPEAYYRDIVRRAPLPRSWIRERVGGWTGDANFDARELIQWAMARGVNPAKPTWTTLGTLLNTTLADAGLDGASLIVALIVAYRLCFEPSELQALRARYGVPEAARPLPGEPVSVGPEIEWRGPDDAVELQSWIKPAPPLLDVGFLQMAILRAASVCRVEGHGAGRQGTGVLVAPDLLLTNYHVLKMQPGEDLEANARTTSVRFGCIRAGSGQDAEGQVFPLDQDRPIVWSNESVDFVLLRVDGTIRAAEDIRVAPIGEEMPKPGSGLNILQHYHGEAMKLAISSNGVTGVYTDSGVVQYVTAAGSGSSGSPCFDDQWDVVALHRAERSRPFGRIREGILLRAIRQELQPFLP
jgi:hypothetical protein